MEARTRDKHDSMMVLEPCLALFLTIGTIDILIVIITMTSNVITLLYLLLS